MKQIERITQQPRPHHRPVRKQPAVNGRCRAAGDQQDTPKDGHQRPPTGIHPGLAEKQHPAAHQGEPRASRPQSPAVGPEDGSQAPALIPRQQRPGGEFPCPAGQQEKGVADQTHGRGDTQPEGTREQPPQNPRHPAHRLFPGQQKQRREKEIELFLHRQRPEVQQGLGFRRLVEITHLPLEHPVLQKHRARRPMFPELLKLVLQKEKAAATQRQHPQHQKRGHQPSHAPRVKIRKPKRTRLQLPEQDPGDQIPGDHEKNVHPGKSTGQRLGERVEPNHTEHCQSPQPINVRPVTGLFHTSRPACCGIPPGRVLRPVPSRARSGPAARERRGIKRAHQPPAMPCGGQLWQLPSP